MLLIQSSDTKTGANPPPQKIADTIIAGVAMINSCIIVTSISHFYSCLWMGAVENVFHIYQTTMFTVGINTARSKIIVSCHNNGTSLLLKDGSACVYAAEQLACGYYWWNDFMPPLKKNTKKKLHACEGRTDTSIRGTFLENVAPIFSCQKVFRYHTHRYNHARAIQTHTHTRECTNMLDVIVAFCKKVIYCRPSHTHTVFEKPLINSGR